MPTSIYEDPVFTVGQTVKCRWNAGYHFLTEGKQYVVTGYTPRNVTPTFTWPAYVDVIDDSGRRVGCHASRFEAVVEESK